MTQYCINIVECTDSVLHQHSWTRICSVYCSSQLHRCVPVCRQWIRFIIIHLFWWGQTNHYLIHRKTSLWDQSIRWVIYYSCRFVFTACRNVVATDVNTEAVRRQTKAVESQLAAMYNARQQRAQSIDLCFLMDITASMVCSPFSSIQG